MDPQPRFVAALAAIQPLEPALITALLTRVRPERWPAHHRLLEAGQVARRLYFLESGLVRGYTLRQGREVSSWFMREGDFVLAIASFFTQTPSEECLELLEPGHGFSVSYEQVQQLYHDFPAFNFHGRVLTERYYVLSEARARHLRAQSAAERYAQLLRDFPTVFQRVSVQHIASHLGMAPETLSRLRSRS
ncbi:Crp/Fnr family transcriptional regulator [Hymenobacter norwichensis]|uniref:Crp/Fnr family transcriptional regulator n=1 Tax=Hymenobacter norwichensis TaxID=223903 RepID=UPI0003B76FBB|nr:Crp/Fnr family transcriptional regulator [Hymenobacter norwichensis]